MVEVVIKIPAIEKLLDITASGVGGVAGPLLLPWRAYMKGEADRISARAYADVLPIITKAQDDARQSLVAPDAEVHGAVEITHEHLKQVIEFQGLKRLANIASVVEHAAEELDDKEVPDREPDHDWTARFFDCVQDVSSEHMQRLWAKVLSGEVESPGRTSLRTLETLRNMTQREAEVFERIAPYVIDNEFVFCDRDFIETCENLRYPKLLHLKECGLLNIDPGLISTITWGARTTMPLSYGDGVLLVSVGRGCGVKLDIPVFVLTTAGKELFRFAPSSVQQAYLGTFARFLHDKRCQLAFAPTVSKLPDGKLQYDRVFPIEP